MAGSLYANASYLLIIYYLSKFLCKFYIVKIHGVEYLELFYLYVIFQ